MVQTIPQLPKQVFSPKRTGEKVDLGFDMVKNLGTESIINAGVTVSVENGTDATPSALLDGPTQIRTTWAVQRVQGGVVGVTYLLTFTITTSAGRVMQEQGYLSVTA